jgi:hypothetical protein
MRQWIRSHLTYSNVMVTILAFVVLGGGGAYALNGTNTVQSDDLGPGAQVKAPDVAANAVNGANVKDGSLGIGDLSANARIHKLEFDAPIGTPKTPIATVGNAQLSVTCGGSSSIPLLFVYLKNVSTQTGTMNDMFTIQQGSNGPIQLGSSGQFVGAGDEFAVDGKDNASQPVASGSSTRAEGQVIFRTPGRVTTINFHAFTTNNGAARCEFYGTGVTSSQS